LCCNLAALNFLPTMQQKVAYKGNNNIALLPLQFLQQKFPFLFAAALTSNHIATRSGRPLLIVFH
jgi:hypothetical protein